MSKGFASNYRTILLATGVIGCFCVLGTRLVFLHVIDRDDLVRVVEKARRQIIPESARRGDILDTRGNILATSRSMIVLGVDPQSLRPEDEKKWPELAALIEMPLFELKRIFEKKTRPAPIAPPDSETATTAAAQNLPLFSSTLCVPEVAPKAVSPDDDMQLDDRVEANGERLVRWAKLNESITETTYAKIDALGIKGVYGFP